MPYRGAEEPRHSFKSKISSPTKRTLNNKNYLAEDATPVLDYTGCLGQDLTDNLRISPGSKSPYAKAGEPMLQPEPPYFIQNYRMAYTPGHRASQQPPRTVQTSNRTSPGKSAKAANAKAKNVRCKEKQDASMVPFLNKAQKQRAIANRYFSPPVDLQKRKRAEGKLRPLIDVAYSSGQNSTNYRNYKLFSPVMLGDKRYHVVSKEIENIYRREYCKAQPLYRFGDKDISYNSLQEMTAGLTEYLRDIKTPAAAGGGRTLATGSSWNESFELSFDGKAIDRSDIFRIVDSFSVALSDDDPEEESNRDGLPSTNVLPAEMSSPAF
ncbi:hypothetical protein HG536_0H00210 [Torulaspora globosa]|uniref:Uncharacterized protein n=1 Tax=Torulaspora globosa TaxID=48254 RepID=A0A7G3ZMB1_9SACH|nr:uncharacterized protein HG536_0H00210 [Torulaspora globosa]QLL34647.1 hypothetical protein HG536_0H00210 [Torulaspora globosa]